MGKQQILFWPSPTLIFFRFFPPKIKQPTQKNVYKTLQKIIVQKQQKLAHEQKNIINFGQNETKTKFSFFRKQEQEPVILAKQSVEKNAKQFSSQLKCQLNYYSIDDALLFVCAL